MAITLSVPGGTVVLGEMWDGYDKGIDASRGPWIKQVYYTPDPQAVNPAINALMGAGLLRPPFRCPESRNLFCMDASFAGEGEIDDRSGGRPKFRINKIAATFAVPAWSPLPETAEPSQSFPNEADSGNAPFIFMEQSIDWDTEVHKLPEGTYKFAFDGSVVDVPVAKTVAVAQFVLVRKFQSQLPYLNVAQYLNRLNDDTLLGQPKGLLKLRKVGTKQSSLSDGTRTSDIAYTFNWREYDHNFQMTPSGGGYQLIIDQKGNPPYQYAKLGSVLA